MNRNSDNETKSAEVLVGALGSLFRVNYQVLVLSPIRCALQESNLWSERSRRSR